MADEVSGAAGHTASAEAYEDFDGFVRGSTRQLLRAAYLLTGDQLLAEDLVQAALCRTYLSWSHLDRSGNAYAYTRKIMYRLQVDWWRRRRVVDHLTATVPDVQGADPADVLLQRLSVSSVLAKLPPRQRAVLTLRFLEDLSEADVASLLGCSTGTVKSQTSKAIAKLRQIWPALSDASHWETGQHGGKEHHVEPR
jgi:RNA polymerase sigma-70 factor (sigma-E family)